MTTPSSLYVHIPFCSIKCTYCAFNTFVHLDHLIPDFVTALCAEIRAVGEAGGRPIVHTVYLGGGTPSLLTIDQINSILQAARDGFEFLPSCEISMECNPSDMTPSYTNRLRETAVNRLSIGMQSAVQSELDLFARRHEHEAVKRAVEAVQYAGFDNFNLDLIYGIPGQSLENWKFSLEEALSLAPHHVSLYALGLEPGTALEAWVNEQKVPAPDDDLAADMYEWASERLPQAGLEQYEISNWAQPGHECRHNLQYWRNLPYPAFGPGAHGYAGGIRYVVLRSPQRYIQTLRSIKLSDFQPYPHSPVFETHEYLDQVATIADTLIMGLRLTQEGIVRSAFQQRFGIDLLDLYPELIARFEDNGLLSVSSERVKLTARGRLLSNMIFRELV